jgi:hypothetical protein
LALVPSLTTERPPQSYNPRETKTARRKVNEIASFWKIAIPVTCVAAILGATILWRAHSEKASERKLVAAAAAFRVSAQQGDASAQYSLGHMYYHGEGMPRDYAQAAFWYRKAADQGDMKGEYGLGYLYYNGQGLPQDYAEAVRWYLKAADQGDAKARVNIALAYYYGQGVPQDYTETLHWYRIGADQGDAMAEDGLGLMYYEGHGVPQDYAEAVRWYSKAADQGYAKAQYDLGVTYFHGQGVRRDRAEANRWFEKAAEQGDENARRTLGSGLTTWRELELSIQGLGGILLLLGSFLSARGRSGFQMTFAPAAGILCILVAGMSWYGYTHYLMRCLTCGLNTFTVAKWSLNAVVFVLLIAIVRPRKKPAVQTSH